jgi:uncharacterized membrane protein
MIVDPYKRDLLRTQLLRLGVSDTVLQDIDWMIDDEAIRVMTEIKRNVKISETFVPELNRVAAATSAARTGSSSGSA